MAKYRVISKLFNGAPRYRIQKRQMLFFWKTVEVELAREEFGSYTYREMAPLEFNEFSKAKDWLHEEQPPVSNWDTVSYW